MSGRVAGAVPKRTMPSLPVCHHSKFHVGKKLCEILIDIGVDDLFKFLFQSESYSMIEFLYPEGEGWCKLL